MAHVRVADTNCAADVQIPRKSACELRNEGYRETRDPRVRSNIPAAFESFLTCRASFWVCEKSDGVRVLLYIQTNLQTKEQDVFLVSLLLQLTVVCRAE